MNFINFILPTIIFQIERWKWNEKYNVYVSNTGKIKNKNKEALSLKVNRDGYLAVYLTQGGQKYKAVHRLVMETWYPIEDYQQMTIDHLDHNKRNNSIKNLQWVSSEENSVRAVKDFISIPLTDNNYYIKAGRKARFESLDIAVAWVMENYPMEGKEKNIAFEIDKAIANKTLYLGRKWKKIIKC